MYTKSTGIVQYNATEHRVEHLRPIDGAERGGPDGYYQVEEFLTGNVLRMVAARNLNEVRQHENLHVWGKELYAMEMYVNLLRDVHRMVIHHGSNTEVFGSSSGQEFIMKQVGNKIHVAMRVSNLAMLKALDTPVAGIMADGTILRDGTVTTFESFLSLAMGRIETALKVITNGSNVALKRQWEEAAGMEIHEIQHFYVAARPLSDNWDDYLDLQGVCDLLRLSDTTVNRYRGGHVPAGRDDFPKADRYRGRSPYWLKSTIVAWERNHVL
ncbi:hypothetical protein D3C76_26070 [compost metagenome]